MKKLIIPILFFLTCGYSIAQKSLFDKALSNGPRQNGFYLLENKGNRMLVYNDLANYAIENEYVLGEVTYKEILRFGETATSVNTLEFLPKSLYDSYIYNNVNPGSSVIINSSAGCRAFTYSGGESPLIMNSHIKWSGGVKDGKADGNGVLSYWSGNKIIYNIGTFKDGFPSGSISVIQYDTNNSYSPYDHNRIVSNKKIYVGDFHEGLAYIINDNNKCGFVDDTGNYVITYLDKVISDFRDGVACVVKNGEEIIIDRNGIPVDYTENQKFIFASNSFLETAINQISSKSSSALTSLMKSHEYGNPRASYWLGVYFEQNKQYNDAVLWYKKASETKNNVAEYRIGLMYLEGKGVAKDTEMAYKWFKLASDHGSNEAKAKVSQIDASRVSAGRKTNTTILEDAYISAKDVIDLEFQSEDYLVKYMKNKKKLRRIYKSEYEIEGTSDYFSWEIWGYNIEYDDETFTYKALGPGAFAYINESNTPDGYTEIIIFDEKAAKRFISEIMAEGYKQVPDSQRFEKEKCCSFDYDINENGYYEFSYDCR